MRELADWQRPEKAWAHLVRILKKYRRAEAVREAMAAPRGLAAVTLPGFSLLGPHASPAFDWCVPVVSGTLEDTLYVYEEFVERPQSDAVDPSAIVRKAFGTRQGREYVGAPRPSAHWWLPAVQLILAAHKSFGGSFSTHGDSVGLDLGEYVMMVGRDGCWSNFRSDTVAYTPARDALPDLLSVPPLPTTHPLAEALLWQGLPDSARWAANAALRKPAVIKLEDLSPSTPIVHKPRASGMHPADAAYLASELVDAIQCGYDLTVAEMYGLAVPGAIQAREFLCLIGDPWKTPDRIPRDSTRQRLLARLLAKGAVH